MNTNTVRKYWLIFSIANLLLPIILLFYCAYITKTSGISYEEFIRVLFLVTGFLVLFFSAYKKPGTTLVTLVLLGACIYVPYSLFKLIGTVARLSDLVGVVNSSSVQPYGIYIFF